MLGAVMSESTDTRDRVIKLASCGLVQIDGSDQPESRPQLLFGRRVVNSYCGGILGQRHLPPIIGNSPARTPVSGLFRKGRPFAVCRFVMAVAVDALKCVAGWALPHIRNKVCGAFLPPIANRNASAAIGGVTLIARVLASVNCVSQRRQSSDARFCFQNAMTSCALRHSFTLKAPTASDCPSQDNARSCRRVVPAVASKTPKRIPAFCYDALNPFRCYQPAKSHAGDVFCFSHG